MAEITKRRTGELLRGVFKILVTDYDGLRANELLKRLEQEIPPTPFEKSDYPSSPGVRHFEKIARFPTIGPIKAGWLEKSKGRWTLTGLGKKAFKAFPELE